MVLNRREKERKERRKVSAADWAKEPDRSGPSHLKLPAGVTFFKLEKVGKYDVDFMPFLAGKTNKKADPGFEYYSTMFKRHFVPTPDGKGSYCICAYDVWEEPCAVCTWINKYRNTLDSKLVDQIKAKDRQLWLIKDITEKSDGYKVYDANIWNRGSGFGEMLKELAAEHPHFADPIDGETARLTIKDLPMQAGKTYKGVTRIDFIPRAEPYPENISDETPCLDDCLVKPDYKSVWKILETGTPDSNGGDDEVGHSVETIPDSSNGRLRDHEDVKKELTSEKGDEAEDAEFDVDDIVIYEGEECEITKINKDGSLNLATEDGDVYKGIPTDEVSKAPTKEQEEEEETPRARPTSGGGSTGKKTTGKPSASRTAPETEEEETEDSDDDFDNFEEEEPEEKPKPKPGKRK